MNGKPDAPEETKEIITLLLDSKCSIDARDPLTSYSALDACLAAESISNDIFDLVWSRIILDRPRIAEEAGTNGQRPLHVAVVHNAPESIIEHLCRQGREALESYDVD